jgi:pyruvate/2-oxoglutarate dehydrogenase complex dihydrolipoamide acyltransferase (E2) component
VSIGSVQRELVLDGGQVRESPYITIGLTYDRGVIDGPDAEDFLTAFKSTVEVRR